jgi:hypothetical protein
MRARILVAVREAERDEPWPTDELGALADQVAAELGLGPADTMELRRAVTDRARSIRGAKGEHLTGDQIDAALDGELRGTERMDHLVDCALCSDRYAQALARWEVFRVKLHRDLQFPTLGKLVFEPRSLVPSVADIREWLLAARGGGATHVVIIRHCPCQLDYPVWVVPGQVASRVVLTYHQLPEYRVLEVYSLEIDIEEQLAELRAFHF